MTSHFFKSDFYRLFEFVIFYEMRLVLYLHIILRVSVLMCMCSNKAKNRVGLMSVNLRLEMHKNEIICIMPVE